MSIEAMKQALEALEDANGMAYSEFSSENLYGEEITALRQAIAEMEKQEPVAFASHGVVNWIADKQFQHEANLYTHPPKREWVGLTDEEIEHIEETTTCYGEESWLRNLTRNIEAKLKEKNA